MNEGILLPLLALPPLLISMLGAWRALRPHLTILAAIACLPPLLAAVFLPDGAGVVLPQALFSCQWRMDGIARIFLALTGFGWLVASLFARGYLADHPRRDAFTAPFALCMCGNFLLPAAADAITFISGFALMSFAAWPLVTFDRRPSSLRAGAFYVALVVLGELLVFPGLVQGVRTAGSVELAAIRNSWVPADDLRPALYLLLVGFGVKAGIAPFHFWLPLAHPAAPTPASAVLSGCMIKAGLLGWLRLFPLGRLPLPHLAETAGVLGAITLIGALLLGLGQGQAKALLAYSSMGKMATILLLLVPAMADPSLGAVSISAACAYALFHSLHKVALFLGVAVTPGLRGRGMRFLGGTALVLLAASFAGLPLLSGAVAKLPIKSLYPAGGWLWPCASFLTILLMLRFLKLTWPGKDSTHAPSAALLMIWLLTIAAALAFPVLASVWGVAPGAGKAYTLAYAGKGLAPILLAGLAAILWRACHRGPPITLPAGDLALWVEKALRWLPTASAKPSPARADSGKTPPGASWVERVEEGLSGGLGGLVFLLLTLVFLALLWGGLR